MASTCVLKLPRAFGKPCKDATSKTYMTTQFYNVVICGWKLSENTNICLLQCYLVKCNYDKNFHVAILILNVIELTLEFIKSK